MKQNWRRVVVNSTAIAMATFLELRNGGSTLHGSERRTGRFKAGDQVRSMRPGAFTPTAAKKLRHPRKWPLAALLCWAVSGLSAQPVNNSEIDRFGGDMGHIFHWVKVPTALLKQCAKLHPDAVPQARVELSKWAKDNAAFNVAVENSYERFKPRFARFAGMSVEQVEGNFVIASDAQAGVFMKSLGAEGVNRGCHRFELLLQSVEASRAAAENARRDLESHFSGWAVQP